MIIVYFNYFWLLFVYMNVSSDSRNNLKRKRNRNGDEYVNELTKHKVMRLKKIKRKYFDKNIEKRMLLLEVFKKKLEDNINDYRKKRLITFSTDQKDKTESKISIKDNNYNITSHYNDTYQTNFISKEDNLINNTYQSPFNQSKNIFIEDNNSINYSNLAINGNLIHQIYLDHYSQMIVMSTQVLFVFLILCSLIEMYMNKAIAFDVFILIISFCLLIKLIQYSKLNHS